MTDFNKFVLNTVLDLFREFSMSKHYVNCFLTNFLRRKVKCHSNFFFHLSVIAHACSCWSFNWFMQKIRWKILSLINWIFLWKNLIKVSTLAKISKSFSCNWSIFLTQRAFNFIYNHREFLWENQMWRECHEKSR